MAERGAPRCAVLPVGRGSALADAVRAGGGTVVDVADAEAVVWTDPRDAAELGRLLARHPALKWVQLPFAGIEPFVGLIDHDHVWACGKGVYAEPVAEHVVALALAGMRGIGRYTRATSWTEPYGHNLLGARVVVLGGGGITASLLRLLAPFGCHVTVLRRHPQAMDGATEVARLDRLHAVLATADLVVLALALTPETEHVIDAAALAAMPGHAWLVNVARGGHVDTAALVTALRGRHIGGAALDVTDPEPLPDDHPLWQLDNCILTPHTGNTPAMARPLLAARVRDNVSRYASGQPLLGLVDPDLGY